MEPTKKKDFFEVAGHRFRSRLLVGTGKYKDFEELKEGAFQHRRVLFLILSFM